MILDSQYLRTSYEQCNEAETMLCNPNKSHRHQRLLQQIVFA